MASEITVVGIDPALGTTGYGVIRGTGPNVQLVDAGTVRASRAGSLESRLHEIHQGIVEILTQHRPQFFAMEQVYTHYERPATAILMGHARGVICLAAAQAGLEVCSYEATKIKRLLTGNGRAPKSQMQGAVQQQLRLRQQLDPPDVADALAVALCHYQSLRVAGEMLESRLQARHAITGTARIRASNSPTSSREPG